MSDNDIDAAKDRHPAGKGRGVKVSQSDMRADLDALLAAIPTTEQTLTHYLETLVNILRSERSFEAGTEESKFRDLLLQLSVSLGLGPRPVETTEPASHHCHCERRVNLADIISGDLTQFFTHNSSPSVCACDNRPLGEGGSSSPRPESEHTEGEPHTLPEVLHAYMDELDRSRGMGGRAIAGEYGLTHVTVDLGDAGHLTVAKDMLPDLIVWLQIAQAEMERES